MGYLHVSCFFIIIQMQINKMAQENKDMFEKGIALKAPEGMYNIKDK